MSSPTTGPKRRSPPVVAPVPQPTSRMRTPAATQRATMRSTIAWRPRCHQYHSSKCARRSCSCASMRAPHGSADGYTAGRCGRRCGAGRGRCPCPRRPSHSRSRSTTAARCRSTPRSPPRSRRAPPRAGEGGVDPRLYAPLRELERTHWWFRGRRRILLAALERAGVGAGARALLDVGCGAGTNLEFLAERFPGARAHGIDVERAPLRFCRADRGLPVAQADAERLPFAAGAFDLVAALDALEHLADDAAGLREIHRVLRPGGALVATVPAFPWLWGSVDDLGHHRRRYRRGELSARVCAAGFEIALERYFNF